MREREIPRYIPKELKNILLGLGCRSWSTLFKIQCSISFLNCYLATFEKLRLLSKNFSMLLWATFGKIGLVFIPTFGSHVVCSVDVLRTLELSVTHIHVRQELTETLIFFVIFLPKLEWNCNLIFVMTTHFIYLRKVPHKQCVKFDYILKQQNWVKVTKADH